VQAHYPHGTTAHVYAIVALWPFRLFSAFLTPIPSASSKVTFTVVATSLPSSNDEDCKIPRVPKEALLSLQRKDLWLWNVETYLDP